MDKRQAIIVKLTNDQAQTNTIKSNIDETRPKGGSRSKTPYGPVITVKEKSSLDREKHQFTAFFENIIEELSGVDNLYIFGPSQTKDKFLTFIKSQHSFSPKIVQVDSADSMTENQVIAEVKGVFEHLS